MDHTAHDTIVLLMSNFGESVISRYDPVNWPPRSYDLKPLDIYLWGYLKSLVNANKVTTLEKLRINIAH